MDSDQLQRQLTALHEELSAARRVDPQVRGLLVKLMDDIARLLERPPLRPEAPAPAISAPVADPAIADRLEAVAVQFEADHPGLAASVRRFVDLLAKAGL